MSARLYALETRELQRISLAASALGDGELVSSNGLLETPWQGLSPNTVPALENNIVVPEFVGELKRSWVYRRNSAFRLSTYSSDRNSTTWSCLSSLSLSEVSNISVLDLAVTVEDFNTPQRLSQTWSNDPKIPMHPVPAALVPGSIANSHQHALRHMILLSPSEPDDEPSSMTTVTASFGVPSREQLSDGSSTPTLTTSTGFDNLPNQEPLTNPPEQIFYIPYPCKGCGEVSHFALLS